MDLDAHDELISRIGPDDFGQLLLHIFAGGLCDSRDAAYELISNTMSAAREIQRNRAGLAGWEDRVHAEIDYLIQQECLVESRVITPTLFGISVAGTGLKPATVNWFLRELFNRATYFRSLLPNGTIAGDEDALTFILAHAALTCPEYDLTGGRRTRYLHWRLDHGLAQNPWARRLSSRLFTQPWIANRAAANGALVLTAWAEGRVRTQIERLVAGVRLGTVQNMARDAAWILSGIADVIGRITAPSLDPEVLPTALRGDAEELASLRGLARTIKRQAIRLGTGLPADVLWMTALNQVGPRARLTRSEVIALREAGMITPLELMRGDQEADSARQTALASVGTQGRDASSRIRDAARIWKLREREHCQRIHERRTAALDGGDLVRRLYLTRGGALEDVLDEAFDRIEVNLTKLDDGRAPDAPIS
jgi:ATP-dependent DNA helicase